MAEEVPTSSDIEEAARLANAHDFIMALPQGYDTVSPCYVLFNILLDLRYLLWCHFSCFESPPVVLSHLLLSWWQSCTADVQMWWSQPAVQCIEVCAPADGCSTLHLDAGLRGQRGCFVRGPETAHSHSQGPGAQANCAVAG